MGSGFQYVITMLDIVTLGDEVLREKAAKVTSFGPELRILVDAMIEAMQDEQGLGLAAPQVGVPSRIFVVDLHQDGEEPRIFINPDIIETSQELVSYEEGCLSIPGVYADVSRPERVKVQAQDLRGKAFVVDADGMLARVIQHENDHLNGVLFIDRLNEERREKVLRAYGKRSKKSS